MPTPPAASRVEHGHNVGEAEVRAIVVTALELRGIPYKDGGGTPAGFDCSGFTQYVFGQHGVSLPRNVRDQSREGRRVGRTHVQAGDLIFFSTIAPGPSHVAIALDGEAFVHAPSAAGVVRIERLETSYWKRRLVGIRRIVGD